MPAFAGMTGKYFSFDQEVEVENSLALTAFVAYTSSICQWHFCGLGETGLLPRKVKTAA
jgi:hypothetical protein